MGCDEWAQLLATDWVTHELGARLVARHGELHDQVGLAVRVNPRRAHLLVSSVLGKYIPTHPGSACWAGMTLGRQVARCLGGSECSPLVVGYAETATALGHGAKFYPHLAQADPSNHYLDAISAHFGDVADAAARRARKLAASPRPPRHTGWAAARRIGTTHGVEDMNFVKPGVGETTRALLRRVPWKVLIDHTSPPLPHIRLLASQRRAHLLEVSDLPFSCVALIHPRGNTR